MRVAGTLLVALLLAQRAGAQHAPVRLTPGAGEAGVSYDGSRGAGAIEAGAGHGFRQWLTVPLSGEVGGPGVVSWSAALRPVLQQQSQPAVAGAIGSRQLDLLLGLQAFSRLPVSVTAAAQRASGASSGGLGSRRVFRSVGSDATLAWRNRLFPMQVAWQRRRADDRFVPTAASAPVRSAWTQRAVRFGASSSRTNVDVQRLSYIDRVLGSRLDAMEASALHTLRWGAGSRLESAWQRSVQRGALRQDRSSWSERAHLRHSARLASDVHVGRVTTRVSAVPMRSGAWGWTLTGGLARGVSGSVALDNAVSQTGLARSGAWTVAPGLGASTVLPGAWRLTGSAVMRLDRRRVTGADSQIVPVPDEAHVVPAGRSFTLGLPGAVERGLVVRSGDGTVVYAEGLDYVVTRAGVLLRIDMLPGSRIHPGETVLVSYGVRGAFTVAGTDRDLSYEVGLARSGVSLRHRRAERNAGASPDLLASVPGLVHAVDERTDLALRHATRLGTLSVEAGRSVRRHGARRAGEVTAGFGFVPPPVGPISGTLSGSWSTSRAESLLVRARSLTASAVWRLAPGTSVRGGVEAFRWAPTNQAAQRYVSLQLVAEMVVAATEVNVTAEWHHRAFLERREERRLTARIVRRF